MVESIRPLVLITGVTGFLGSHVCMEFLKSGNFKVRGSVRDLPTKTELLKKIYGDYLSQLELVEMNLLNEDQIEQAVVGCHYVVHVASPNPQKEPKDEREIIDPAFKGTLYIIRAA